jgi:hypothetical protein
MLFSNVRKSIKNRIFLLFEHTKHHLFCKSKFAATARLISRKILAAAAALQSCCLDAASYFDLQTASIVGIYGALENRKNSII